jgi:subtilisin-like proprotein convertase family protein
VQHILVQSARLNDVENPDWVENGAGRMFHPYYGFGVVDAEAAVALAETWSSKGPEVQWDSGVVTLDQTLDTQESATFNVKAPVNFQIEHLQLELESLHQLPGEMEIFVTSPAGTTTQLVSPYFGGADITFDHPLTSTDLWDEWAFGDWTIEVVNGFGELELSEMRLTLFGNVIQDAVPELRITDVAVPEDRESMNFLVSIDEPYSEDITFTVYTMEDTAVTAGSDPDYIPQRGVEYTIAAGEVAVVVPIELVDNLAEEEDETFWLALSEPVSGRVPFDAVVGTILNEDFPRVIDAAPWDEIGVQGSHAAKSTANEVEVDLGNDVAFLQFDGFAGTKLSLRATPDNPDATVNLQLLDAEDNVIAGPLSSPAPGEPVRVDHLELPGDGLYRWETTTDDLTTVAFEMYANTVIEGWDGDDGATTELTLDPSVFGDLPSRYAVLGTIDAQSIIPELTEGNAGDVFVDISETGTPLNLTDDGVAQVETTIGNRMLPAGPIRISNNGLVLAGSSGIPGYVNEQLPFENLGTLVAPYWDDLTDVSGNVYWEEIDFNGVPTLVVQWDDLSHFNSPTTGGVTFQLHIYQEGSGGPLARYIYNDVSFGVAGLDGGASATVGFQVAESDEANQYSFNTPESIADSDVITWSTAPDVDTFPIDLTGAVGEDIDVILAPLEGTPTNNLSVAVFGPPSDELLAAGTTTPDEIDVTNYAIGIPTFTVANSGTHTVRVEGMGLGDYLLLVTRGGAFDTEPNNDQEETLRKISDSTGAVGFLEDPDAPGAQGTDEVDFYELALTADDRVVLETSVPYAVEGVSHPDSLDPMLELYDPKGALLASDGDAVGDGRNARIRFIAPFDGLYRLGVSAEAGVGRYLVRSTPWVNNVPEEVELTNNELAENTSTDAGPVAVGLLTTIDADPLDTHQYELVSGFGDDDNGAFTIVDDQLFINQGVELDYETKNRFAIRVRSTDDYGDSVESRLNVFVLDRGEVELVTVGTGAQRSRVNQLTVLFDSTVAVNPGAFAVSKRGPEGGVVEVEYTTDTDEFNRTVATITFGGAFFQNDSLVDGNYELRINALRVRDATGNPIDGNRDGFAGGDYLFGETEADGFFRHFGDVDGDREVDFSDFLGFRGAYGTASGEAGYLDVFDVDDDEVIGFADFLEFRNRYGSRLDFE